MIELKKAPESVRDQGFKHRYICPENVGKTESSRILAICELWLCKDNHKRINAASVKVAITISGNHQLEMLIHG